MQIINHIALLTEIRDSELFELCLLKTSFELLPLQEISLLKVDERHEVYRRLQYRDGKLKILSEGFKIPEEVLAEAMEAETTNRPATWRRIGEQTFIYPLLGLGRVDGYVFLKVSDGASESDFKLMEGLFRVYHNYFTLLEDSQRDKLTGLLNRKTFDDRIDKILQKLQQMGGEDYPDSRRKSSEDVSAFWIAVVDIDHFKKINDTYGHLYGDEVLLLLSRIMKRTFRQDDLLFRFGGEEFVVVIKASDAQNARVAFERFRNAVETYSFPQVERVTVSMGVAQIKNHLAPTHVVGQADQALYYSKEHGRNCIHFYDQLLTAGQVRDTVTAGEVELF
jgi:diguanylate cyclase (GGDEF)-like protein